MRGGSFGSCSAWEGGRMTYLGKGRVYVGNQGQDETIQINYKMNFNQDSFQRLSLHFTLLQACWISQKCLFLKNQLFFRSLFSVMRNNSSVLFFLKLYMLWTKGANQSANFQIFDCSHKSQLNSLCHFSKHKSVFVQVLHHSSVS